MGNLTIKKADGTTDVTFTQLAKASGDGSVAVFRSTTTGQAANRQDSLEVSSRFNGDRTARRLDQKFIKSYNVTGTDNVERQVSRVHVDIQVTAPINVPQAVIDEAVAQSANLYKHADVQSACKSGYAQNL